MALGGVAGTGAEAGAGWAMAPPLPMATIAASKIARIVIPVIPKSSCRHVLQQPPGAQK
jgi:hypothetical protein